MYFGSGPSIVAIPYLLEQQLRDNFRADELLAGAEIIAKFQGVLASCLTDLQAGQKDYLVFSRKLRADFITKVVEAKLEELDQSAVYQVTGFGRVEINELRVSEINNSVGVDIAS